MRSRTILAGSLVVLGLGVMRLCAPHTPPHTDASLFTHNSATTEASAPASTFTSVSPIVVDIEGAVVHPGVVTLPAGIRLGEALRRLGGLRPDADLVAMNRAAALRDGMLIVVPTHEQDAVSPEYRSTRRRRYATSGASTAGEGDEAASAPIVRPHAPHRRRHKRRPRRGKDSPPPSQSYEQRESTVDYRLNINRASAEQLARVPGLDRSLAERIVSVRRLNGGFARESDLLDVAGITEQRLSALQAYLR